MTKDEAREISKQLQAVLDVVGPNLGLKLTLGNCKFSATALFQLEVARVGDNGEAPSAVKEDFKRFAGSWGLKPEDLGRTFSKQGHQFTVVGAKTASRRYPILAQRDDGKQFKFPAELVKLYLK